MTVAASIFLAALVGGVVFVLLDGWQRRADAAPAAEPVEARTAPLPTWSAEPRTEALWTPPRSTWDAPERPPRRDDDEPPPDGLWAGWARR